MGLLQQASLVTTPNAVKAGKLYSIIPTNGAGDLDVVRATTATYVGSDGLIKTAGINEPRFDYSNGSCPSILVEPQRTNLNLWSEDLTNTYWSKFQSSVVGNAAIAPSGNMTADKIVENTTNNAHSVFLGGLFSSIGQSLTRSVYLKADGRSWAVLAIQESGVFHRAYFNLSNGTIGNVGSGVTASIEPAANGYYKCTITRVLTTTNPSSFAVELASANGTNTYLGNGTSGIFVWGAQIEEGSNATSYIPTTTSSVTRNADVISKSGISNLIGQTEGSIYCEIDNIAFNQNSGIFVLQNNANQFNNRIGFRYSINPVGVLNAFIRTGASLVVNLDSYFPIVGGKYKMCFTYNQTQQKFFINGVLVNSRTGSFAQPNTLDQVQLGNMASNLPSVIGVKSALVFTNVLSDAEAIQLTTI